MIKWKILCNVFSIVPGILSSIAVRMTYVSFMYLRIFSCFRNRLHYKVKRNGLPQANVVLIKHQGIISIQIHTYENNFKY